MSVPLVNARTLLDNANNSCSMTGEQQLILLRLYYIIIKKLQQKVKECIVLNLSNASMPLKAASMPTDIFMTPL